MLRALPDGDRPSHPRSWGLGILAQPLHGTRAHKGEVQGCVCKNASPEEGLTAIPAPADTVGQGIEAPMGACARKPEVEGCLTATGAEPTPSRLQNLRRRGLHVKGL